MADPLAALGAASSIVALLEFSWKLFSSTKEVYQSATGQNDDNLVLEIIAKDITRLSDSISTSSGLDNDLKTLIKESHAVAGDLLQVLNRLKIKGSGTIWRSFQVALKDVWKKDQIEAFSRRLSRLQSQVTLHIQLRLSDQVSQVSVQLKEIDNAYQRLGIDMRLELQDLKTHVIAAAGNANSAQDTSQNADPSKLPERLWALLDNTQPAPQEEDIQKYIDSLDGLYSTMAKLYERGRSVKPTARLLEKLCFPMMTARETKVSQAHINTYRWIFEPTTQDRSQRIYFADWLRTGNGTFWIHGKPGSGKSTLMKFIVHHEATRDALRIWAGEAVLLSASCFFWYAGSKMQKSQIGLLRSLLYQLVVQYPMFTAQIDKILCRHQKSHSYNWVDSVDDMLLVLKTLISEHPLLKFCFFIDGLDEYEEDGMIHSDLVNVIWELALQPNSKACLSSRPWGVFIDAFETDEKHNITLEHLTRPDIQRYVNDKLEDSTALRTMQDSHKIHSHLSGEICRRAQGVFLWVHLVVKDLLQGLTYGDTMAILTDRLSRFPPDLDQFFQHMIDTIDPIYMQHTARLLDIARTARAPVPMITYSFIDDMISDEDIWRRESVSPMSQQEFSSRKIQMRRRLDGRCKGLLELVDYSEDKTPDFYYKTNVEFIHRTVHEFLVSSKSVQELIGNNINSMATPLVLSKAILLEVKYALYQHRHRIVELLRWVRKAELNSSGTPDELSEVLGAAEQEYIRNGYQPPFVRSACETGVSLILETRLVKGSPLLHREDMSGWLLHSAMNLTNILAEDEDSSIQTHVIEALLRAGVSPIHPAGEVTAWERILADLSTLPTRISNTKQDQLFEAIRLLLENGASLDAKVATDGGKVKESARSILQRRFSVEKLELLTKAADSGRKSPMASTIDKLRGKVRSLLAAPYRHHSPSASRSES